LNIRTGTGHLGTTDGFAAASSTITHATNTSYYGGSSLKTTTGGAGTGWFVTGFTTAANKSYTFKARVLADPGQQVVLYGAKADYSQAGTPMSITGDGRWQSISTTFTNGSSPLVDRLMCLAVNAPIFDFYTDDIRIEGWNLLNTFSIGTGLVNVKLNDISPDHASIQFNDTYWELYRGKPQVYVTHANTPLVYGKKNRYYHDTTTTVTPSAGSDITMSTSFFCNVYDSGDTIGMSIMQKYPNTIKVDSIPATELTGLGYYTAASSTPDPATGYNGLAKQWIKRTETSVGITRP
jgi:hypothetical protein